MMGRDWEAVFNELAAEARARDLSPSDLEGLAEAAWWTARLDACIDARERAYHAYVVGGNIERAAYVALMLVRHNAARAAAGPALGWLRRAERLLDASPPCASHGYLALARGTAALHQSEFARAAAFASEALSLGHRFGDRILEARATHLHGNALLHDGQIAEGSRLIDEAVAAAVTGELGPDAVGTIYCNTIEACRELFDIQRASEWTDAARSWCEREAVGGFPGICRVFRAEVRRLRGDWGGAESEARHACDELRDFNHQLAGAAFNEVGEICLRRGQYDAAAEAFQQGYQLGHSCQPGVALLRLSLGNTLSALLCIERALEDERRGPLARARLLPAVVEIVLAAGRGDIASHAGEELHQTACAYGTPALRAAAQMALGRVALAGGDFATASRQLRDAVRLWVEVDAPYEAALGRTLLGCTHRDAGDHEAAMMEWRAAHDVCERLGASADVARLSALLAGTAPAIEAPAHRNGTWESALAHRFVVERELGRGATATVYLARDTRHQRRVAVKVLEPEFTASSGRFLAEVSILARLTHPHIMPLFDSGEADGHLYYLMPYIDGNTLRHRLEQCGQLPESEIVRIGAAIASALAYAHAEGVVHRDIKPENILFQQGHVLVADFGIARLLTDSGAGPRLTRTGLLVGTPAYMSPEQAVGDEPIDGRTDIYSLGCVLYEMLTGQPPFSGASVQSQVAQRMIGAPRSVKLLREDASDALEHVVARALAADPSQRYATATDLSTALAEAGSL